MAVAKRGFAPKATKQTKHIRALRSRIQFLESEAVRQSIALRRAETLATVDALTGLHNRRAFDERLREVVAQANRDISVPLVLALFDLDHFKSINDTYGHTVGDIVLKKVGEIITPHARSSDSGATRSSDFTARIGGEEFAFILQATDVQGAEVLINRLRVSIQDELIPTGSHEEVIQVTASFGVALWRKETPDVLFKRADQALYEAKHNGRNRVAVAL